jgi:beta,beta-carotene 9',10'-dioxygenase
MNTTQTQTHSGQHPAFQTLDEEVSVSGLRVEGQLPHWLAGTLVRMTPAGLDVAGGSVRHWFDGLAMLNKFSLADGQVSYANRYLRTETYRRAHNPGARRPSGFATDPCRSIFSRIVTTFSPVPADNANINVVRLGNEFLAMTEGAAPIVFEPSTLATLGASERVPGKLTTAHPHFDPAAGVLVNYATHMGRRSKYRVYTRQPGGRNRVVGEVRVAEPGYIHSFGMTARYVVLAEFPLVVNPLDLVTQRRSFIESFRWEPSRGTRFLIIDRATGRLVKEARVDPFFAFHHVNAFEEEGAVVVDLCAYPDAGIIDAFFLHRLRANEATPQATLRRYRVRLDGGRTESEALSSEAMEMPRIAYRQRNARPYRYVYGGGQQNDASVWLDQLVKVDVVGGEARVWREDGCYPGEPVFVSERGSEREDGGVVLSVVLDASRDASFLLVLDGSLAELARAYAPHAIPQGIHGQYFPA